MHKSSKLALFFVQTNSTTFVAQREGDWHKYQSVVARQPKRICQIFPFSLLARTPVNAGVLTISSQNKKTGIYPVFYFGAERGIRTPGNFRFNGFQDRRNRPLYPLCIFLFYFLGSENGGTLSLTRLFRLYCVTITCA